MCIYFMNFVNAISDLNEDFLFFLFVVNLKGFDAVWIVFSALKAL